MTTTSLFIGSRQIGEPATATDLEIREHVVFHGRDVFELATQRRASGRGEVVSLDEVDAKMPEPSRQLRLVS